MTNLNNHIFSFAEAAGVTSLLQHFDWKIPKDNNFLYVLNYHRIDFPDHRPFLGDNVISTTPDDFEKQMKLVASRYYPLSAEEVLSAIEKKEKFPKDAVLITVDDGYLDFKEIIHPITHSYGINPILFVATNYIGENIFWWDKLRHIIFNNRLKEISGPFGHFSIDSPYEKEAALNIISNYLKRIPFKNTIEWIDGNFRNDGAYPVYTLTWRDLRELSDQGVSVAAHSHTHPILTQISIEDARKEIRSSQNLIRNNIGKSLPIFAYPDGKNYAINDAIVQVLREEGFILAFTTVEGRFNILIDDMLLIPRLGIWHGMNIGRFHFHLTPYYDQKIRKRSSK